jgi:twitching motility two-component system response regulator PilG
VDPIDFSTPEVHEEVPIPEETLEVAFAPEPEAREYESIAADPQAETVVFSYSDLSNDWETQPDDGPVAIHNSEPEIPMPVVDLPEAPVERLDAAPVTFVEPRHVMKASPDSIICSFCAAENDPQAISCGGCLAVLTLSDLEMLLANNRANTLLIRLSVEEMERYRSARPFTAHELVTLGIGHLNLKNLETGYACLSEAFRMTPNDVVLGGQVNSLHIRLDEIRQQEEAHLKMPKGKSILVVDDSPTVRKLISGKLEKCGHEVICANDGVEAMERLEHFVPDLVLLDINMPRMDGYQVCKLIRSNDATKDVAVVMISGKDGFFDKVRGRMAGTTGYITKPFGPETLMKAVEMYLSGEVPEPDEE